MKEIKDIKLIAKLSLLTMMINFGICSTVQATDSDTGAKSGSFGYLQADHSKLLNSCPSPYDGFGVSLNNQMDEQYNYWGRHSYPMWINIYYILDDSRGYNSVDNNIYHKNESYIIGNDTPIVGAVNRYDIAQTPIRSYTNNGSLGSFTYQNLRDRYEGEIQVLTVDMYGYSFHDTYMDVIGTLEKIRIPVRSFKMLTIQVLFGDSQKSYKSNASHTLFYWEGYKEKNNPGYLLTTWTSFATYNNDDVIYTNLPVLQGKVDMRTIDSIDFIARGNLDKHTFDMNANKFKKVGTNQDVDCNN